MISFKCFFFSVECRRSTFKLGHVILPACRQYIDHQSSASPFRPGFDPMSVRVGFVVDRVAVRQVLSASTSVFPRQNHSTYALQGLCKILPQTSRVMSSNPNRGRGSFKHRPVPGSERFFSLIERLTF